MKTTAPGAFYLANGTEWMVRVMPEARHRDLPLWFALGTTLSDVDGWAGNCLLRQQTRDPIVEIPVAERSGQKRQHGEAEVAADGVNCRHHG